MLTMSEDNCDYVLNDSAYAESEDNFNVVKLNRKKRLLSRKSRAVDKTCQTCERSIHDPELKFFQGPPEDAMEEEAALTDPKLQLYDENCLIPEIDSKPVHRLTKFSVFDGEGHLCEFDTGLIEKNKQIFCSGYIKPIYDEDSSPDGGVPAQEIGPIDLWWISGFDGGNNFLLALASPCAEYILMEPSREYESFMMGPRQKALLTKIVVEFLSDSYEPSFEELMTRIQEVAVPQGVKPFDENTLQQHAQFVVEQVLEIDDDNELISTPAMQSVIKLYNVKIKKRATGKRFPKELKLSRAAMTPLVSDIFENFFMSSEGYFNCDVALSKKRLDFIEDSNTTELSSYSWNEGEEFAIVNDNAIHKGDFVCISAREPSIKNRIFRIEYFFQRNFTKQAHCRVYCSGMNTVIGESSNPYEFFCTDECGDWPICKIIRKIDVSILKPPEMSQFYDYRVKTDNVPFVQKRYIPEEGRFVDFDAGGPCSCGSKVSDKAEVFEGSTDSSGFTIYDKITWKNEEYVPGCCVFVEPFAVTLNAQKSSRNLEKIVVTLKADEKIYPEIYRKGKEIDSSEECPEPFKIAYVKKIYGKSEGKQKKLYLKVNKFYRPEDTGLIKDSSLLDLHLLYWSDEETDVELDHVRGLCDVTYSGFSREFNYSNEFYFQERFDCDSKTLFAATEVALVRKGYTRKITGSKLKTMNVFCGSGGLAEGLTQSGVVDVIWGIEIEESAAKAFKSNFPQAFVYRTDCNTFLKNILNGKRDRSGLPYPEKGDVELMCGGPPCQGFSTLNRFTAKQYSQFKNSLIVSYLSFCDYYRPKYFLLENVKNFVAFKKSAILKYTMSCLITMGYQCSFAVLQAGNYGVPQNRKRLFILASAPGVPLPKFPVPTHVFNSPSHFEVEIDGVKFRPFREWSGSAPLRAVTIRDALHDLPPISPKRAEDFDETNCEPTPYQRFIMNRDTVIRDHVCKEVTPLNEARIKHIPACRGCDWRDLPNIIVRLRDGTSTELLKYSYHDTKQGNSRSGLLRGVCSCASGKSCDPKARQTNTLIPWFLPHTANRNNNWAGLYGRLDWDGYFSTTITNPEPSSKQGKVIHPVEDRIVSVRECARSQGLPDSFRLYGTIMEKYRQVGNSVPPPLARVIGYEIKLTMCSSESCRF